jgi:hypothetical protein
VIGLSDALNSSSNHLQTDLWTSVRTEDFAEHLKHHMRTNVGVRVPWFVCDTCVSQVLIAVKCAVVGSFVATGV